MAMRKAEMAKMQEQHRAEREKMKAQKEEMRAAEKARKEAMKGGVSAAAAVEPSPSPEPEPAEAAEPEYDSKHSAEWNAKHNKEMKLASKHSDAWNAAHAASTTSSKSSSSTHHSSSSHSSSSSSSSKTHHSAAKAPKAVSLVGESSDAANRMAMRKAEMAKMQEQHRAEREKMKAQKEEMRAAEKARKEALKGGASDLVEPSPSPEEEEEEDDLEVVAAEYNDKHSEAWNAKHSAELKKAAKHSEAWNAKHAKEEQEKAAAKHASSSSKKLKAKVPKAVVLASEGEMSKEAPKKSSKGPVHSYAWQVKHAKAAGHSDAWIAKNVKKEEEASEEEEEPAEEAEDEAEAEGDDESEESEASEESADDKSALTGRAAEKEKMLVHAEDLLVDERRHREAVEAVRESLPEPDVVPALALVVESVDAVDRGALVVAPQEEKVLGVLDLVRQQQADDLQALLPPVDVVPQEEVVGLGGEAPVLEQPQQVRVLPVDVAADLDRRLELQEVGLRGEDVPGGHAEPPDLLLGELHLAAGAAVAHVQQTTDDVIHRLLVHDGPHARAV